MYRSYTDELIYTQGIFYVVDLFVIEAMVLTEKTH